MKNNFIKAIHSKSEKGAITLFVLLAILFFIIVLFGLYYNLSTKNTNQAKEIETIIKNYNLQEESINQMYENTLNDTYFSISLSQTNYVYDGTAKTPTVTVRNGDTVLTNGKDYSVSYSNNVNAGTAIVTVTGMGEYSQKENVKFTISRAKTATVTALSKTYNGSMQVGVQSLYVSLEGTTTAINVGSYTATATPDSNHAWSDGTVGTKSITWKIAAKSIPVIWGDTTVLEYNGEMQVPEATCNSGITDETINLSITGQGKNAGTYTATASISSVTGGQGRTSNYVLTGNTKTFTIVDKTAPTIANVNATPTSATSYTVNITGIADEGGSGLAGISISTSNSVSATDSSWVSNTSSSYIYTGVQPAQTYYIYAKDNNGNISEPKQLILAALNYDVDNSSWHTTLGDAINAAESGSKITCLNSNEDTSLAVVSKDLSLDVNGKTISRNEGIVVNKNCTFTLNGTGEIISTGNVIDTSGKTIISYDGKLTATQESYPAITNKENGELEILSGDISANSYSIWNNTTTGTVRISGGTYNSVGSTTIYNLGNLYVTGGTITSNFNAINSTGSVTISGNTNINGQGQSYPAVSNSGNGKLEIISGTITAISYAAWNNSETGTLLISGGNLTSTGSYGMSNKGECEISGDAIIKAQASGYPAVVNTENGKIEIQSGTMTAVSNAVWNNTSSGTITIYGGNISSTGTDAIDNDGTLNVINGVVTGNRYAIYNGTSTGIVKISGGTISSNGNYAINNYGTMSISGGMITAPTQVYVIYNNGTLDFTGGTVITNQADGIVNRKTFNMSGNAKIEGRNMQTSTAHLAGIYNSISGAITTISGGTITSTAKAVHNMPGATVNITGGTLISASSTIATVTNQGGNVNIYGGTIQNTGTSYAVNGFIPSNGSVPSLRIGSDTFSTTSPNIITAGQYAVYENGNFTFYGGRLQGTRNPPYNKTPTIRSGYKIVTSSSGSSYYSVLAAQ